LGDVVSNGAIATGGIDGNREDLVFLSLEKKQKGVAVALLAGFD
jgi:hypothetical protein